MGPAMKSVVLAVLAALCSVANCSFDPPDLCQAAGLESRVRFSLKSERNETGPWISTVTGERATPGGVTGADSCPWEVRVGHEVTTCPLQSRGVRLAATIEIPPPTTEYKTAMGHSEYKLDLRLVKWELARQYCQQEGADLVVINSRQEADLMKRILAEQGVISEDPYENKQVWVGIHDRGTEGRFVTVYDEPLSETGYVSWSQGEPNNLSGSREGEDCVSMLRSGDYNDEICNKKLAFICERPYFT